MKFATLLCLVAGLAVTGCAASVPKSTVDSPGLNVTAEQSKRIVMRVTGSPESLASPDWERLVREWRKAVGVVGQRAAIDYSLQTGTDAGTPAYSSGPPGVLVVVDVRKFSFVAPGSRIVFGFMAGEASLDTHVRFADMRTGSQVGERSYDGSSTTGSGPSSGTTDKQVEAICQAIATDVSPH
jgi:uncharacterized protein DUF4410